MAGHAPVGYGVDVSIPILALRAAIGGALVVVFALVGEVTSPKAFSGLFSSAPSVATASLAVTAALDGPARARQDTTGMVVGGLGMTVCCLVAAAAIPKMRAVWGSLAAWLAWGATALGLYWAVFVGAR